MAPRAQLDPAPLCSHRCHLCSYEPQVGAPPVGNMDLDSFLKDLGLQSFKRCVLVHSFTLIFQRGARMRVWPSSTHQLTTSPGSRIFPLCRAMGLCLNPEPEVPG